LANLVLSVWLAKVPVVLVGKNCNLPMQAFGSGLPLARLSGIAVVPVLAVGRLARLLVQAVENFDGVPILAVEPLQRISERIRARVVALMVVQRISERIRARVVALTVVRILAAA
jgi:hypothetical protein